MSLRNKLLLSFILTTFLPILILGIGSFHKFQESLIKDRISELDTIADLKVTKIETFFQERMNNIETIQDNPDIGEYLQTIIQFKNNRGSTDYRSAEKRLDGILKTVQVAYDYIDVMLVDTEGKILYISNTDHRDQDLGQALPDPGNKSFEKGRDGIYISTPFINNRENNIPALLVTAPIQDATGTWLGLVVFEMDMAPIYHFIQDTSGLGLTGETLIGRKEGDSVLFLNAIRHDETPTLQKKVRLGSKMAFAIQKAVQGENGDGLSYDYRPKKIIAAWRYIPLLDWGMVAKIDTEEAFGPIEQQKQFLLLVSAFTLFFGGAIFMVIARSITHPINAIQEGMAKVKEGQLDLRLEDTTQGEIAPLVLLFNEMLDDIKRRNKDLDDFRYALNAATIVSVTDLSGDILFVNDNFCKTSRYRRDELIGNNHRMMNSEKHSKKFIKEMWMTISGGGIWRGNFKNKAKDGSFYWADTTIVPFLNKEGRSYQFLSIQVDITHRKNFEEKVFRMAHYDDLTGLPNRILFSEKLENTLKISLSDKRSFALMFLDLDEFKLVNDTLGHPAGDQLLREVSRRLKASLRDGDIVARMSGDEFIILLPSIAKKEDVSIVANKIIGALKKSTHVGGEELFVTCSIGISLFPDHGETPSVLMKNADIAMYHAKKSGRGKFRTYSTTSQIMGGKSLSMTSALHHAIEREEFVLFYQPILDLNQGHISGMEALIRWHREGHGLVSPADFIPLAEKTGLILPMGEWVLKTAMAQLRTWREAGFQGLAVSVNVAAPQFQEDNFVENTTRIMTDNEIGPDELKLELTESILMINQNQVAMRLQELKKSGVQLSIDDFGTGFSSLSYLKHFPIHSLKIDQSFIRGLPGNQDDAAITNMIIALAGQLKIDVIAEGIETKEQRDYLMAQGCGFGQGYLFSRPVPAEEFTLLLESGLRDENTLPGSIHTFKGLRKV